MFRRLVILSLLVANVASAQERLTLEDAIARSLEYNFDIKVARKTADIAAANNTPGNAGMLPNVNANAGVTTGTANTHIEFADGRVQDVPNAGSISYNGAVTLNWTLFDGGRMFLLKNELNKLQQIGEVQLKAQIQATVSQVIQAYAQVVWQQQQGVAIDTGLALAKMRMTLSQVQFETGASAKVDYLQARVDYNARRSDSLNQEAALTAARANLNALMGTDADVSYTVDDSLQLDMNMLPENKERLQEINLSLDIARRNAEVSKLNARVAKTYHLPTLALNGSYNYTRTESQSGFSLFSRSYGPSGGLALNLPLFQGGNIHRNAKVASLQAMRDDLLYQKQNTELSKQYRTAWRNYEVSVSAYKLEQENVRYAKENSDIQKARFKVGIANTLEAREAENSYVTALVRLFTAAYNLKVNETIVRELENDLVK